MVKIFEQKRTNREIIAGVARGDVECVNDFHERFGKRINGLVWSLIGADSEQMDLVQTVFINILTSIKSVRDANRLGSWVDSVVFRTVRKELRRRGYRRSVVPMSDMLPDIPHRQNNDSTLVALRFYQLIDTLDTDERMIFILRYMGNHTLVDLAQISGWSVSTVKRRIRSATENFKAMASTDPILSTCTGVAHVGS